MGLVFHLKFTTELLKGPAVSRLFVLNRRGGQQNLHRDDSANDPQGTKAEVRATTAQLILVPGAAAITPLTEEKQIHNRGIIEL